MLSVKGQEFRLVVLEFRRDVQKYISKWLHFYSVQRWQPTAEDLGQKGLKRRVLATLVPGIKVEHNHFCRLYTTTAPAVSLSGPSFVKIGLAWIWHYAAIEWRLT